MTEQAIWQEKIICHLVYLKKILQSVFCVVLFCLRHCLAIQLWLVWNLLCGRGLPDLELQVILLTLHPEYEPLCLIHSAVVEVEFLFLVCNSILRSLSPPIPSFLTWASLVCQSVLTLLALGL